MYGYKNKIIQNIWWVVRANDFRLLTVSRLGNDHDDSALIELSRLGDHDDRALIQLRHIETLQSKDDLR
jgi:hypothetical protein